MCKELRLIPSSCVKILETPLYRNASRFFRVFGKNFEDFSGLRIAFSLIKQNSVK